MSKTTGLRRDDALCAGYSLSRGRHLAGVAFEEWLEEVLAKFDFGDGMTATAGTDQASTKKKNGGVGDLLR